MSCQLGIIAEAECIKKTTGSFREKYEMCEA